MSLESDLHTLWSPLTGGRMYPDVTPDRPFYPCMIYQQIGGYAGWYVENTVPSHLHARIQLHVWGREREEVNRIAREAEHMLCESGMIAEPFGAITALYEEALKLYGTRQDFGIWYPG